MSKRKAQDQNPNSDFCDFLSGGAHLFIVSMHGFINFVDPLGISKLKVTSKYFSNIFRLFRFPNSQGHFWPAGTYHAKVTSFPKELN